MADWLKAVFTDIVVGLPVADWMADIVLTDAPGTGSIVESHEAVINKIIPESQLVLHVVDAERIGDSTDKYFAERIANFQHRKIFYIMNKIDRMSGEGCEDAQMALKKTFPSGTAEDCVPEIIPVSAMSALLAMELRAGMTTVEAVMNNRKLSLAYLWGNEKFRTGSSDQKLKILCNELWKISNFEELQDRVSTYLRKENKQMAIVEDAWGLVRGLARDVKGALDAAIRLLNADSQVSDLEREKEENQKKRDELKKVADRALAKYVIEVRGGYDTRVGKPYDGANGLIRASLRKSQQSIKIDLNDWLRANYKEIAENKEKVRWHIQSMIEEAVTRARRAANDHAKGAVSNLQNQIVDVLREARNLSFETLAEQDCANKLDCDTSIALLGFGIMSGSTATVAATGAGIGASIGSVVPVAGTALGAGIGAGVGAVAGLIGSGIFMGVKGKDFRVEKIVSGVDESVTKLFFEGGKISKDKDAPEVVPYMKQIVDDLDEHCGRFRDELQKLIARRFSELTERDNVIIREISSSKKEKERKVFVYSGLAKQCSALLVTDR